MLMSLEVVEYKLGQDHEPRTRVLQAGHVLTFGRQETCDIVFDDPGISRLTGTISESGGNWWLKNSSARNVIHIVGSTRLPTMLAPRGLFGLTDPDIEVVVTGSIRRFALLVKAQPSRSPSADDSEPPITAPMTSNERAAIIAILEGYLERFPRYDPNPRTYAHAASRLGLSPTVVRKRIERVRAKLERVGLIGQQSLRDMSEFLLVNELISASDLVSLRGDDPALLTQPREQD